MSNMVIGYNLNGQITGKEDSRCVAYQENNKCFVKQNINDKQFLNLQSPTYTVGDENRIDKNGRGLLYQFKSVSNEVFKHYIQFLRTGNIAWLKNAERLRM